MRLKRSGDRRYDKRSAAILTSVGQALNRRHKRIAAENVQRAIAFARRRRGARSTPNSE